MVPAVVAQVGVVVLYLVALFVYVVVVIVGVVITVTPVAAARKITCRRVHSARGANGSDYYYAHARAHAQAENHLPAC